MTLKLPPGPITILEEIVWDEATHTVDFRILEHPSHTGNVINRIDKSSEGELLLTFEMDWKFKGEGPDPMEGLIIKNAVCSSVKHIESQVKKEE